IFADLVVFLDDDRATARDRKARLDEMAHAEFSSDAPVFIGTPSELADVLVAWQQAGLSGFRLRPGALPHDLTAITRALVPELRARDAFRDRYEPGSLRARLGLTRPANRFANR
ncbi:MAG: FMNH2-dependent monooxygenase, partial [Actinomycetota bacterium]|nr:FMNH2-dependent monooxygenase [Actinomycetota bacterium]